ncbi:MAG: diacylglycerol kinase [Bacteroidetes bacterium]|nr:diacylglycerol kinase [Bacteroidota bacterium]
MIKKNKGIVRIYKAFFYSMDGLKAAFKTEAAFRQELLLGLLVIPYVLFFPMSLMFKSVIFFSYVLVLVIELINSAIEAIVDLASPEHHELAKKAKDVGSAAVLICILNLAIFTAFGLISHLK